MDLRGSQGSQGLRGDSNLQANRKCLRLGFGAELVSGQLARPANQTDRLGLWASTQSLGEGLGPTGPGCSLAPSFEGLGEELFW